MQKTILLLCSFALCINSMAAELQAGLDVAAIPDSLIKDAYAVVRYDNTTYEYKSVTSGIEKHSEAYTILDKKGEKYAEFYYPGDRFRVLKSFSGKMYDAKGNLLKKYKLSDVNTSEWSASLASDARHYFFSCTAPSIPFTIVYEYEIGWNDGILSFPTFAPQTQYNLSVEKATYQLILPEGTTYKSKALKMEAKPETTTIKGLTTNEWTIRGLNAISEEPLAPDLNTIVPTLYTSHQDFIYDKVPGSMTDWKSLGEWSFNLGKNRDLLPEDVKSKLIEMTKNAGTDREKVKIIYNYLGEMTHYVSIQLGIGGFRPMLASEVCSSKFGDCKALSNYLKAMLAVIGIPSNYCVIRMDRYNKVLYRDYPNFNQANHAIIQVPLKNDTLWLECTNPKVPFGFVHGGISGHDVLVCTAEGGIMQKTPDYPDSLNIEKQKVLVEINPDGSAKVTMQKQCHVKMYDDYSEFSLAKPSEQADILRKNINLPNVTMGVVQFKEDKSSLPILTIDYLWNTTQYGSKTGNRLFIPVNPYQSTYQSLKTSKRLRDIKINRGYKNWDSICIRIPEGYSIEALPAPIKLTTPYGNLMTTANVIGKEIFIKQMLFVPSGDYNVSNYSEFVAFFEKVSFAYKGLIILNKQVN